MTEVKLTELSIRNILDLSKLCSNRNFHQIEGWAGASSCFPCYAKQNYHAYQILTLTIRDTVRQARLKGII